MDASSFKALAHDRPHRHKMSRQEGQSRILVSVQTTCEKALRLHDQTHSLNKITLGQGDEQGSTGTDRAAFHGRPSYKDQVDWTPYEDAIRLAAKADLIFAKAFRTQEDRTFPSQAQRYHKEKPEIEKYQY